MKKIFCIILYLIFCCAIVYGINIDFSWSLGEIGIENTSFETKINSFFSVLNIYWIGYSGGIRPVIPETSDHQIR